MDIARMVATRSTCERRAVGAVLVIDKHIISTGYNGARSGEPHCLDVGCQMEDGHCTRTLHAEENALNWVMINTRWDLSDATLYCTVQPCTDCQSLINNCGATVIFGERYR